MNDRVKAGGLVFAALGLLAQPSQTHSQQPIASFYYDDRGNVIRQAQDTNGDGKMDRWIYYDAQGKTERIEQDVNFDGKADIVIYYESRQAGASGNCQ